MCSEMPWLFLVELSIVGGCWPACLPPGNGHVATIMKSPKKNVLHNTAQRHIRAYLYTSVNHCKSQSLKVNNEMLASIGIIKTCQDSIGLTLGHLPLAKNFLELHGTMLRLWAKLGWKRLGTHGPFHMCNVVQCCATFCNSRRVLKLACARCAPQLPSSLHLAVPADCTNLAFSHALIAEVQVKASA